MSASLCSPECEEAYKAVFSDDNPADWCWLAYEGQKLKPLGQGSGGLSEMTSKVDDNLVLYGLLRLTKMDDGGDSKRVKFVFLTWVGEAASPLKKGKVNEHKGRCAELFKGFHIEKALFERADLEGLADEIDLMLKNAGGANYDMGNIRSGVKAGGSVNYKSLSKKFFSEKEKETQIKNVVYSNDPLSKGITACDLGVRAMTVGASQAKKNTVGYDG